MSLALSPAMLAAAFELLKTSQPFAGWNLPDADDIVFRVVRTRDKCGFYRVDEYGRHSISISTNGVGQLHTLVEIMAHEMVHLHLALTKMEGRAEHGAVFRRFADRVCHAHGFDPKRF